MTLTPGERAERNRIGARALNARLSPEQRRTSASRAWLAAAVNGVIRRASELTPCQRTRLRALAAELADPTEAPMDQELAPGVSAAVAIAEPP